MAQLKASTDGEIYYFDSESSKLELDFLLQAEQFLLPIEVKAEENLRSKSLRQFHADHPQSLPVRVSMSDYRKQDWMINIPLYAAERIPDWAVSAQDSVKGTEQRAEPAGDT